MPRNMVLLMLLVSVMSPLPAATTPPYTPVVLQCHASRATCGIGSQVLVSMSWTSKVKGTPGWPSVMSWRTYSPETPVWPSVGFFLGYNQRKAYSKDPRWSQVAGYTRHCQRRQHHPGCQV